MHASTEHPKNNAITRAGYLAPGVPGELPWHEALLPLAERANFYNEPGRIHARVSCNPAAEFGVFLSVALRAA